MVSYEELSTVGQLNRVAKGRFVRANQAGVDEFDDIESPSSCLSSSAITLSRKGSPRVSAE
jgi:hypothetical protein